MKTVNFFKTACCITVLTIGIGCQKEKKIESAVIKNIGNEIIIKTYGSLFAKCDLLQSAIITLQTQTTETNLTAAREAWISARTPWEQAEGFLVGPVAIEELAPAMDSWPVNITDLDTVLSSSQALTATYLAGQEGTLKGYHTIEYLLWGVDGNKTAADFTTREFEYLSACGETLAIDAKDVYDSWQADAENYIENLLNAGEDGSTYTSTKAVLVELTQAMHDIAEEVAEGKMENPYVQQNVSIEESQFSNNSKADFANNIRSIRNMYSGEYEGNGTGEGINGFIEKEDEALNSRLLSEIDEAISAIENLPGTFGEAIINSGAAVIAAQEKVRTVRTTLADDILPIISGLK